MNVERRARCLLRWYPNKHYGPIKHQSVDVYQGASFPSQLFRTDQERQLTDRKARLDPRHRAHQDRNRDCLRSDGCQPE